MLITLRNLSDPEVRGLVAEAEQELIERYDGYKQPTPVDSDAQFLTASVDGVAVGCGAIQLLGAGVGEVKRMYVRPTYRGRGIGRRLFVELEALADRMNLHTLRLETGTRQPESVQLVRNLGYLPIPIYGVYTGSPYSICFEKRVSLGTALMSTH